MPLSVRQVPSDFPDLKRIEEPCASAFPAPERIPFLKLFDLVKKSEAMFLAYYSENRFLGFTCTHIQGRLAWLFYFAILPEERGKGLGSRTLRSLLKDLPFCRVTSDIEDPEQESDDTEWRRRRMLSYEHLGFEDFGIRKTREPIRYDIMAAGGAIAEKDHDRLLGKLWTLVGKN